jgi:tetratricopeptide (TPR) repeat protein
MLLPILQSCAELKSRPEPKDAVKTPPPVKKSSKKSIQTSAQVVDLAKVHMKAGDYQKAINIYNFAYRRYPTNQGLLGAYVKSVENIKTAADKAFAKADFASAGRNYDFLLKNYTHFTGFEKKLSFQSTQLNEKLSDCRKALYKKGFQEYRKENLSGAIKLWQHLFDIDPQNPDIKKLLRTARMQQKNLQEKE